MSHPWKIAVIGAGPAGLALALHAARRLPAADISLFDARPLERDVAADPRTLALSLGSVIWLRRLGAWPAAAAQPILEVHVSQAPPTLALLGAPAEVRLSAADEGVEQLGAVLSYGALVSRLQQAWLALAADSPRLHSRFGLPVSQVRALAADGRGPGGGAEVDAGVAERFDLAVVAEGGVFAEQARKAVVHDYRQTAWVGTATLAGATPGRAVERFTRHGPVALLPLPPAPPLAGAAAAPLRAALVWCVPADDDPVAALGEAQRVAVLNSLLPEAAGRVSALSPLKHFALGLNAERTLVDGAVVRIGNAAQTLHPVAGQGLNLGLRDAAVLVEALREATPDALPQVLRRLEWQRAPDRWSMIAATDFLARSFTWAWPGLPAARGLGLAALQALPPLKHLLARQMMFGRR
ncbi:FAD-dependent monooxygenase [Aquabacterium sp. OR-4]|uniref:FAD-dependent monooxygenase n=1 Tax=Aquabacterium sp. OR-4 TaxID=2978127 RepID=UPI0021B32C9F|nr:FAD-dependent monooxygenase [Aquabacterium sp. OR-4]MDT7834063.1 FAD-dependent monooxygenase [Aquabacterium sp. OR-4]